MHDTDPDPLIDTTLAGKYRLVRMLGKGGMGAVYEARNLHTERKVAVKVMLPNRTQNPEFVSRFLREARAAGRIEHPHVVSVLDVGEDPETHCMYMVMEYMQGTDLRFQMSREHAKSLCDVLETVVPVMSALAAAHAMGVVHRDVKPENVFLVQGQGGIVFPKLLDFGIAKLATVDGVSSVTRTGAALGTPYYMSPEQARGERDVNVQTDVWAMGVVAFEMLAGYTPFHGDNYNQVMARILMDPVPRLDTSSSGTGTSKEAQESSAGAKSTKRAKSIKNTTLQIPEDIADIVQCALDRDRTVRYASMNAMLQAWLAAKSVESTSWGRDLARRFMPESVDPVENVITNVGGLSTLERESTVDSNELLSVPRSGSDRVSKKSVEPVDALASSTMGMSATQIETRRLSRRTWTMRAVVASGIVAVVTFTAFSLRTPTRVGTSSSLRATVDQGSTQPVSVTETPSSDPQTQRVSTAEMPVQTPDAAVRVRVALSDASSTPTAVEQPDAGNPPVAVHPVAVSHSHSVVHSHTGTAPGTQSTVVSPVTVTPVVPVVVTPVQRSGNGSPILGVP